MTDKRVILDYSKEDVLPFTDSRKNIYWLSFPINDSSRYTRLRLWVEYRKGCGYYLAIAPIYIKAFEWSPDSSGVFIYLSEPVRINCKSNYQAACVKAARVAKKAVNDLFPELNVDWSCGFGFATVPSMRFEIFSYYFRDVEYPIAHLLHWSDF